MYASPSLSFISPTFSFLCIKLALSPLPLSLPPSPSLSLSPSLFRNFSSQWRSALKKAETFWGWSHISLCLCKGCRGGGILFCFLDFYVIFSFVNNNYLIIILFLIFICNFKKYVKSLTAILLVSFLSLSISVLNAISLTPLLKFD